MPKKTLSKPGRPKLPPKAAKTQTIPIRVTEKEKKRITQMAKANDLLTSEWVRQIINEALN